MVDVGDVSEGVSDAAPAAESVERGAGDPSASPRMMGASDDGGPPDERGDFITLLLLLLLLLLLPPITPPPRALGCKTLGAGLGGNGGKSNLRSATRWPVDGPVRGPAETTAAAPAAIVLLMMMLLLVETVEEVDGV